MKNDPSSSSLTMPSGSLSMASTKEYDYNTLVKNLVTTKMDYATAYLELTQSKHDVLRLKQYIKKLRAVSASMTAASGNGGGTPGGTTV